MSSHNYRDDDYMTTRHNRGCREFLLNFPPKKNDHSVELQIAKAMGFEAWIGEPRKPCISGDRGFYIKRSPRQDLTEFWKWVERVENGASIDDIPRTVSYAEDEEKYAKPAHHLTNFLPQEDDYSTHLRIAEELGYKAWIGKPSQPCLRGAKGFYIENKGGCCLGEFWALVDAAKDKTGK